MNIKNLFNDDRAVSPVIGVILMVAITVILAAVIGTFVLGLGDSLSQTSPQATYDWSQNELSSDPGNYTATVEHTGGDSIEPGSLSVTLTAGNAISFNGDITNWAAGDVVKAGDSFTFNDANIADATDDSGNQQIALYPGDTVGITWQSDEGGSSQVLTEYEVNS